MKLVRVIKVCLNDTYSKVRIGKNQSEAFPIQNGRKQRDALEYAIGMVQESWEDLEWNGTLAPCQY
jgi:hypothetical protein